MNTVIKLLTFIPWILYFIEIMLHRISVLQKVTDKKGNYFAYINKNFFKSFNIKELALFCIFIIFIQYQKTVVLEILFSAIYVYLLIDFFHTIAGECSKIKNKWLMVFSVALCVCIGLFFLITNHLYTTYILMFIVSLFSSFIMYIFYLISPK